MAANDQSQTDDSNEACSCFHLPIVLRDAKPQKRVKQGEIRRPTFSCACFAIPSASARETRAICALTLTNTVTPPVEALNEAETAGP
jgi:hypothetical protein